MAEATRGGFQPLPRQRQRDVRGKDRGASLVVGEVMGVPQNVFFLFFYGIYGIYGIYGGLMMVNDDFYDG